MSDLLPGGKEATDPQTQDQCPVHAVQWRRLSTEAGQTPAVIPVLLMCRCVPRSPWCRLLLSVASIACVADGTDVQFMQPEVVWLQ